MRGKSGICAEEPYVFPCKWVILKAEMIDFWVNEGFSYSKLSDFLVTLLFSLNIYICIILIYVSSQEAYLSLPVLSGILLLLFFLRIRSAQGGSARIANICSLISIALGDALMQNPENKHPEVSI